MLHTATHHRLVIVDVLDLETGDETGRSVAVECWYIIERQDDYGADADGRRGVPCEDVTVLDMYLNPSHRLNAEQMEQVLDDARRMVEKGEHDRP